MVLVDPVLLIVPTRNVFSVLEYSSDFDVHDNVVTSSIALGANPISDNE